MEIIESKDNKICKKIIKLKSKKHRDTESEYIVEGEHLTIDSLKKNANSLVIISNKYFSLKKDVMVFFEENNIEYVVVDDKLFGFLSETDNPQGILAIVKKTIFKEEDFFTKENNNIVVLDRIQDPGNVGTIIRTARATNHKVVIMKGTVDPYSSKVVRAAMSAISDTPMIFVESYEKLKSIMKEQKIVLVGTHLKAENSYKEIIEYDNIAIVMGNESQGIHEELIDILDKKIYIPMEEGIESLNVSVAAGIIMYESYIMRTRKGR